jgi:penicillin amidase
MRRVIILFIAGWLITSSASASFFTQGPELKKNAPFAKQVLMSEGEEVTIIRDSFGVPHILADSERAVYYGGGYATAQDRLFQMERYRRDARGQMAEIDGRRAFMRDQQVRRLGYTEAELQAAFDALGDDLKRVYQAYADGINAYIKEAVSRNQLPSAFKEAGIEEPAPWKVTDSVAITILMAQRFGSGGGNEANNLLVLKWLKEKFGGDAEKIFKDLFWVNDPKAPVTIPDSKAAASPQTITRAGWRAIAELNDEVLAEAHAASSQEAVYSYSDERGLPSKWGSYAWVIAPRLSVGGNAVLVGGPQMGFSTPQIAHEIHYSARGLNVIGMGFPGVPEVLIGHNDHLAWTTTSGLTDMVDIFAEKLNPQNKHQYFYKGQYRDMQPRVETINIKGEEPRRVELFRTAHGPVVGWDEKAGVAYSSQASYAGHELSNMEAIHGFNRARTIQEFDKLCERIYTTHNFFVATADGSIGYWHCGKPPVRAPGVDPRLPTSGVGDQDWLGLLPASQMPRMINPRQGYLINWNNKPTIHWDSGDRPAWGEVFRIHRIEQLIKSHGRMTFEQVRDIAQDIGTNDSVADYLKPHLLAALKSTEAASQDARLQKAGDYLRAWDNHSVDGLVAKTIFDAWFQSLREEIFADEFKQLEALAALAGARNFFNTLTSPSLILHALDGTKSGLPPSRDYFNGRSKNDVIVGALKKSLDKLEAERGPQMNLWRYSQGDIDFRSLPAIPGTNRGTYIQVIEVSKPTFRSESILPPGQSESPGSPHYGDQREMAGYWRFKPMIYKREQLEKAAEAARK